MRRRALRTTLTGGRLGSAAFDALIARSIAPGRDTPSATFSCPQDSRGLRSRSRGAKNFLVPAVVPSHPPGCPQPSPPPSTSPPDLSPASSTGQLRFPLTLPNPRAIVLPTRDPRRYNGSRSVRGRQSANPRITGGLVIPEQAKRSLASPVGIRDTLTGSKRAAALSLGLLAGTFLRLAATYGSSHTAAANISRLPARRVVSPGARMQVHPTNLPLDLVDLAFAVPSPPDSIASCSASRGSHCSVASSSLRSSTQRR